MKKFYTITLYTTILINWLAFVYMVSSGEPNYYLYFGCVVLSCLVLLPQIWWRGE